MRFIICGLLIILAACTDQRAGPVKGERYIISKDGGGQIISALSDRARLLLWAGPVEIRDYCASACVIFTTLPNACIDPAARIGFHSSTVNVGFVGNPQMARYMRGGVKERFLAEWQFVPPDQIHWISAQDYVTLDPKSRLCGG